MTVLDWPALGRELRPWSSSLSEFDQVEVATVPAIAVRPVVLAPATTGTTAAAHAAVRLLDDTTTVDLTALAGALLRSESVASSKIEHLEASQRDLGMAMLRGVPVHTAAAHVAANVRAMTAAVAPPLTDLPYHVVDLLHIHRLLMEADPYEGGWAGRLRTMQNWIGGGELTPHGALFVPPAPDRVPGLVDDLVRFCNRTDVDPIAQAAITHAQFETIHPFTDGNGRTGRALVHVVLRRRGLTRRTVVPVSTVLLADVEGYFTGLDDYRAGRLDAWVTRFAAATTRAASSGLRLATDLATLRVRWHENTRARRGSAVATLLEALLSQPVVDIDSLRVLTGGVADKNIYAAIGRLETAGVLTELSGGGRNRVWAAVGVLELLERLESELGRRSLGPRPVSPRP
ncbi:MAG: Fic family protein [Kineosporiaceae bacterium]|nr:Fic family protein [Kineosporiaceae bacterium]